ncbi:MAG: serine/threonine protein kinase [Rhodopirellula sp.]|nr:serine/threonine protein kinase [Rhodopirellula sp.]
MSDVPQQPNKIDDYILIAPIASGKSAVLWEVMHEQSNQMFAMKLLNQNSMQDPEEKALLKLEAKIGSLMEHPNLIRNHGVVIRKTECYLLMDLFKTPNLKAFISSNIQMVHANFRQLVEGICAGLGHMHGKGWVHRDLKPENILLNRAGEVRLIDFSLAVKAAGGLAKLMGGNRGPIRGTRTYLAPETIRKEPTTPATDIYSLGVTFFECLTGTTPFKGDTPQDLLRKHIAATPPLPSMLNEKITPEMDRFILKMLAKKPKDRHQSMDEVLRDFNNCQVFKKDEEEEERQKEVQEARERQKASGSDLSEAQTDELRELMSSRRDSRADARIQAMIQSNPAMHREYEAIQLEQKQAEAKRAAERQRRANASTRGEVTKPEEKPKPKKKKTASPQQPMMPPMQQPMMPPGYAMPPQQMPYGMPPGYGMPQQMPYPMPPQGYPQQPMMSPGMQQPGMPMMPPPGMPQQPPATQPQGSPQQTQPPVAPQQPVPQQPVPQQPTRPPAAQPPTVPQPAPSSTADKDKDDGMEFMTELPDIE